MENYILWDDWVQAFSALRAAFSRQSTYLWCMAICAGMMIRRDLNGVTSFVRSLGLPSDRSYHSMLRVFTSSAVDRQLLIKLWFNLALRLFTPMCVNGRIVLICDGITIAKEGKRTPGVKLLHQSSSSNAKAEFVMGHSIGAISLGVVAPNNKLTSVPIVAEIFDGIIRTHRGGKTTIEKMACLASKLSDWSGHQAVVVADAFYATKSMLGGLSSGGNHLVSRVKSNAVAYLPLSLDNGSRKRGRPRVKGEKIRLSTLFSEIGSNNSDHDGFTYLSRDLYWPAAKAVVRFVLTVHKTKGKCILVSTDRNLAAEEIIQLYRSRWSIETSFKTSKHVFGIFNYHFWSKTLTRKRSKVGTRLVGHTGEFRSKVEQKVEAFHLHMVLGSISHGLARYFSLHKPTSVWQSFHGWIRTINKDKNPSEAIVAEAMRTGLSDFLRRRKNECDLAKFIDKNRKADINRETPQAA